MRRFALGQVPVYHVEVADAQACQHLFVTWCGHERARRVDLSAFH